jgi:hypothetical protein
LTNTDIILATRKALASPNWLAMPAKAVIQGGLRWADEKEKMGLACSDHTTRDQGLQPKNFVAIFTSVDLRALTALPPQFPPRCDER